MITKKKKKTGHWAAGGGWWPIKPSLSVVANTNINVGKQIKIIHVLALSYILDYKI